MYNGIGLTTVRGSGTNGYVQKNLSFVRNHKDNKVKYKTEEEIKKSEALAASKEPNRGIIDHERKRKLEVKCMELEEVLREQVTTDKRFLLHKSFTLIVIHINKLVFYLIAEP